MRWRTSGVTSFSPAICWTTSPGRTRSIKKTIRETPMSVGIARSRRFRMYCRIFYLSESAGAAAPAET